MNSLNPVYMRISLHIRLETVLHLGEFSLCAYEIYMSQQLIRGYNILHMWTHRGGKLFQNTYNLFSFLIFKFPNAVIRLDHLRRFYEDRLSRSRLVMHNSLYLPFQSGCNRNYKPTIAYSRSNVFLNESIALRCP